MEYYFKLECVLRPSIGPSVLSFLCPYNEKTNKSFHLFGYHEDDNPAFEGHKDIGTMGRRADRHINRKKFMIRKLLLMENNQK